jgi:hypothetical protein
VGEAKQRRETFRAAAISDMKRWMKPPFADEPRLLQEIEALPFRLIERAPVHIMEYCLMKPQECHKNAFGYCDNDPSAESKTVSGWWRRTDRYTEPVYVFHSVVQNPTGLFCMTPYFDETFLVFAPDPNITWTIDDKKLRRHQRDGKPVPYLVRTDPAQVIAEATLVHDRLVSGMNPWEALKVERTIQVEGI